MSYTCVDYRNEMILLALRRRLASEAMSADERKAIETQIRKIEKTMGIEGP